MTRSRPGVASHTAPESPQVPATLSLFPAFSAASAGWWPILLCDHKVQVCLRLQTFLIWAPHGTEDRSAQVRDSRRSYVCPAAVMTTHRNPLSQPEGQHPRSRCGQGCFLLRLRGIPEVSQLLGAAGNPWHSLACGHITPIATSVCLPLSYKDPSHWIGGLPFSSLTSSPLS